MADAEPSRAYVSDADRFLLDGHQALVKAGFIEPLGNDDLETRLWLDCDLASLVENRFFVRLDPGTLAEAERRSWTSRVSTNENPLTDPQAHRRFRAPFWLLHERERVGTVALSTSITGLASIQVSSLYVFGHRRGAGIARRALREIFDGLEPFGVRGLRVATCWTWQPAVRFYLASRMWLQNWKRDLAFGWWQGTPSWTAVVTDSAASFAIERAGDAIVAIRATRDGARLDWEEHPELRRGDAFDGLAWDAVGTFALVLAMNGWPLIRSEKEWEDAPLSCDCGTPEGLLRKIEIFEAWERRFGFEVRTPRLPGIAYRDWNAIE